MVELIDVVEIYFKKRKMLTKENFDFLKDLHSNIENNNGNIKNSSMKRGAWSALEENVIRDYWYDYDVEKIAKFLNRNVESVKEKAVEFFGSGVDKE